MKKIVFTILFVLTALSVLAAPVITNISGVVSDGQSLTITGTGFGTSGPTIKVFDNYESGTNGAYIADGVTAATIGSWIDCGESCTDVYYSTYSTTYAKSGTKSARQNWTTNNQEGARWMGVTFSPSVLEVYLSFWVYLPTGMGTPDGGFSNPNWKLYWFYESPYPTNDYSSETIYDPPSGGMSFGCVNDCATGRIGQDFTPIVFPNGAWQRFEIYISGSTSSGVLQEWITNASHARSEEVLLTGRTIQNGTDGWDTFHIPGYARSDTTTNTYLDDVYLATGVGARARIEIGDNATYTSCTNLSVATVTSWSDTSVVATIRAGSFTTGTAYVFVVDSDGTVNTTGYTVTLGEEAAPAAPVIRANFNGCLFGTP